MRNSLTLLILIAFCGAALAQPAAGRLTAKKRIALAEEQVERFEYDNAIEQLEAFVIFRSCNQQFCIRTNIFYGI